MTSARPWSSTASTMTAPGCSRTTRVNGSSSGCPGRRTWSSRSRTTHPPSYRTELDATGHDSGVSVGRAGACGASEPDPGVSGMPRRYRGDNGRPAGCRGPRPRGGPTMTSSNEHTLSREEAERRAALLEVERYDIEVDLRGLLAGDTVRSVSRIRFRCQEPGATTFVDCAAQVHSATLNGTPLDLPD